MRGGLVYLVYVEADFEQPEYLGVFDSFATAKSAAQNYASEASGGSWTDTTALRQHRSALELRWYDNYTVFVVQFELNQRYDRSSSYDMPLWGATSKPR